MAHYKRKRCQRAGLECFMCQWRLVVGNSENGGYRAKHHSVIKRDPLRGMKGRVGNHKIDPRRWEEQ